MRKMTSYPAARLGIPDRGILRDGMAPTSWCSIRRRSGRSRRTSEPRPFPDGIAYVIVNGELVVDGGVHTGALPGRALRQAGRDGRPADLTTPSGDMTLSSA